MATGSQSRLRRPSPSLEFDSLLSLEESFYNTGYTSGLSDGHAMGLREGRIVGLKRGFERFSAMGKMGARSVVWGCRLPDLDLDLDLDPPASATNESDERSEKSERTTNVKSTSTTTKTKLPAFEPAKAARLEKHVRVLFALSELESLSLLNGEEQVSEFEDRFVRARSKFKVVARLVGEHIDDEVGGDGGTMERGIEDVAFTRG